MSSWSFRVSVLLIFVLAVSPTVSGGSGDTGVWGIGNGNWNQPSPPPWWDPNGNPPGFYGPGVGTNYIENGATVTVASAAGSIDALYLGGSSQPFYGDSKIPQSPQSIVDFSCPSGIGATFAGDVLIGGDGPGSGRFNHSTAGYVHTAHVSIGCGVDGAGVYDYSYTGSAGELSGGSAILIGGGGAGCLEQDGGTVLDGAAGGADRRGFGRREVRKLVFHAPHRSGHPVQLRSRAVRATGRRCACGFCGLGDQAGGRGRGREWSVW